MTVMTVLFLHSIRNGIAASVGEPGPRDDREGSATMGHPLRQRRLSFQIQQDNELSVPSRSYVWLESDLEFRLPCKGPWDGFERPFGVGEGQQTAQRAAQRPSTASDSMRAT